MDRSKAPFTHPHHPPECDMKYGNIMYNAFLRVFEAMPIAVLFTTSHGKFFGVHGGISPNLTTLEDINALDR